MEYWWTETSPFQSLGSPRWSSIWLNLGKFSCFGYSHQPVRAAQRLLFYPWPKLHLGFLPAWLLVETSTLLLLFNTPAWRNTPDERFQQNFSPGYLFCLFPNIAEVNSSTKAELLKTTQLNYVFSSCSFPIIDVLSVQQIAEWDELSKKPLKIGLSITNSLIQLQL